MIKKFLKEEASSLGLLLATLCAGIAVYFLGTLAANDGCSLGEWKRCGTAEVGQPPIETILIRQCVEKHDVAGQGQWSECYPLWK